MQNLTIVRHIVWPIWLKQHFLHFIGIFFAFLSLETYLSFDFQAEIWHEDGPGAWQAVCKTWGH